MGIIKFSSKNEAAKTIRNNGNQCLQTEHFIAALSSPMCGGGGGGWRTT